MGGSCTPFGETGRGNTGAGIPGGGAGVTPRGRPANVLAWSNFMTPFHIRNSQNLVPRHSGTRISVLPLLAWVACTKLTGALPHGLLVGFINTSGKVVERLRAPVALWVGRCHLTGIWNEASNYRV
jgi:hypothetical protein